MTLTLKDVIRPVVEKCGSRRVLDFIYGPAAKPIRRELAAVMAGVETCRMPLSDKRVQYGNLRRALLDLAGVDGACIAAEDHDFQLAVTNAFQQLLCVIHAENGRAAAERFCREYFTNNAREIESWSGNRFALVYGVSLYEVRMGDSGFEIWRVS